LTALNFTEHLEVGTPFGKIFAFGSGGSSALGKTGVRTNVPPKVLIHPPSQPSQRGRVRWIAGGKRRLIACAKRR